MNLNDLINEVSEKVDIDLSDKEKKDVTKKVIEATLEKIISSVSKNEVVKIKDFGTFKQKVLKSRTMTIPFTKEEKVIPERKKLKFLPSNKVTI